LPQVPVPCRGDRDLIERVDSALEVLHGKWKVHLLFFMARGVRRHGRLLACLPGVSKKVMTDTLRALEPLVALSEWGEAHTKEVTAARARFRADSQTVKERSAAA
jgi:DNA-binding HxlR family transcriptional regulator